MKDIFDPINLGGLELKNRVIIPPMDQYSAVNGLPQEWHYAHYSNLALSGAGMLIVEATSVEAPGRISPGDLGLWNDEQAEAHKKLLDFIAKVTPTPVAVQLGHAGRKGSTAAPWLGGRPVPPKDGGWEVYAPSAIAYDAKHPEPKALSGAEIAGKVRLFAEAAKRAHSAGYAAIEVHAAHGYLIHQFLSPITNKRVDTYGGSLQNRMRFPLEVFKAIRAALPKDKPVGVRVSGSDFIEGGWDLPSNIAFAKELEKLGCAYFHVSGGGLAPEQKIALSPGYQVPLAAAIKSEISMPVITVGLITEAELAQSVIATGQADMVAVGRAMLYDPRWVWHAAASLGKRIGAPNQYLRSEPRRFKGLFSS